MSNRKKARMDAIDARLALLEDAVFGDAELPDAPEFSCRPDYEPDDDAVIRAAREAEIAGDYPLFAPPDTGVRERVRERSNLADSAAFTELAEAIPAEHRDRILYRAEAERYAASLRALLGMLSPEAKDPPYRSDLYALIEGCLAGGLITPSGLDPHE